MNFFNKNLNGILVCFVIAIPSWLLGKAFPRNSHDQKKYQIYQNKCSSTKLSTHIWEFPHIPDANGTPCGYKDEAQS